MSAPIHPEQWTQEVSFAVQYPDRDSQVFGGGHPSFILCLKNQAQLQRILSGDIYSAAVSFVRGEFDIGGDIIEAVRCLSSLPRRGAGALLRRLAAWWGPWRLESVCQSRARTARNIRFHYDRAHDFYRQFLDPRMVYSCAYFKDPNWNLDRAQLAKLDLICRKLDLQSGERFLDVGSGWGGLIIHAAESYGVHATGCTLSPRQAEYTASLVKSRGLQGRVSVVERDCRDLRGSFDKIASVGMFEHVGRRRLAAYFAKMHALLEPHGRFLNHGIVRPQLEGESAESLFVRHRVFPGGELAHLADVLRQAERAGFEVLDVENLRPHYALTCRAWVTRLEQKAEECMRLTDRETYRTWLLYLSASSINFDLGHTDVFQVLLAKRSRPHPRHLSREYMYQ